MKFIVAVMFALLIVPALALAQAVPDPSSTDAFLGAMVQAVAAGDWKWLAVLAVIGLTFAVRKYGTKLPGAVGSFLATSRGGAVTALVFALVCALAPAIAGKVPWSVALVKDAVLLGFTAIGGWVGVRRIAGTAAPEEKAANDSPAPSGT